jgi:hypothetical protein
MRALVIEVAVHSQFDGLVPLDHKLNEISVAMLRE